MILCIGMKGLAAFCALRGPTGGAEITCTSSRYLESEKEEGGRTFGEGRKYSRGPNRATGRKKKGRAQKIAVGGGLEGAACLFVHLGRQGVNPLSQLLLVLSRRK